MKRRRLIQAGVSSALFVVSLGARADNHDGSICAPPGACARVDVLFGPNHGHVLDVPAAHVAEGKDRTYDIQGKADHTHTVTVSAADFARLARGEVVRLASTKHRGHLHRVRLRCAPGATPLEWISVCEVEVGGNDGHELVILRADLDARSERAYDIQGVAPHTHEVVLKASHFDELLAGKMVHVTSGPGDAHTHVVAIHPPKKA